MERLINKQKYRFIDQTLHSIVPKNDCLTDTEPDFQFDSCPDDSLLRTVHFQS